MRWLTRTRSDEGGAVIVLVVVATVALVGMAAMVIDVGAILDEKRQLQNGADAAALAVAHSCALGSCDVTLAAALADQNAKDSRAAVDSVTVPPAGPANSVTVRTSTLAASGDTILPYAFGQAVTGRRGQPVRATASAKWSGIGQANAVPLVISYCEWAAATSGGTSYNTTFTGPPKVILFHSGGASDCGAQAGQDTDGDTRLPGGFGWVQSTNCQANLTAGMIIAEKPGDSIPSDCSSATLAALVGTTVLLPIFDDIRPDKSYHVMGFVELRVTGYRFPGKTGGSPPCSPPDTCLGGYFTRYVESAGGGGGPNLGATSVNLVS